VKDLVTGLSQPHQQLLVATGNPGKVVEIKELLGGLPFDLIDLRHFPHIPAVEETGSTFAENAKLKARYYYEQTGLLVIADDSGLEVDALGGEPGMRSARYAGEGASDAQRVAKLLGAMEQVADEQRTARFVCVVALVGPGGLEAMFTGTCPGRIRQEPVGENGFGYDPIFEYPPLGKTFAQLSRAEKSAVSHRGRALRLLCDFLANHFGRIIHP
jgi:XTP/dITP diphosphohydrolase